MTLLHPDDAVRSVVGKSIDLVTTQLSSCVGSVHVVVDGEIEKVASCVFASFRGVRYVVTATHVLTNNLRLPIVIQSSDGICSFKGTFRFLRDSSVLDIAIARLSSELCDALSGACFYDLANIMPNDVAPPGHRYVVFGFPNSKNRRISGLKLPLKRQSVGLLTRSAELLFPNTPPIDVRRHIPLEWNARNVVLLDGTQRNPPAPEGLSGGAVIDLGDIDDLDVLASEKPPKPKIVGVVSSWPQKKLIIGDRLSAMITALDKSGAWPT